MLALFCMAIIINVTACAADDTTQPVPGDPTIYLPGCKPQEPAPAILEDAFVLLVTGAYLALF
jgi:hypothetical protein